MSINIPLLSSNGPALSNGLTNAAYLAKGGLDVMVVEKNDYIGGAAVSRELHKGWIYSNCSYVCSLLRQSIHLDLDLDLTRHGLMIVPYNGTTNFTRTGDYIAEYPDAAMQYREFKRHSLRDADAMHRYEADLMRYAKLIRHFLLRTPADPTSFKPRDLGELVFIAKKFTHMGEEQVYEFIRFMTMSAGDIRTAAPVRQILVKNKRVTGVVLDNGDELYTDIVVSNLDRKRTLTGIMEQQDIPADLYKKAQNFKIRGSSGKLNIALNGMPDFPSLPPGHQLRNGSFGFLDSMERRKRAYDCWKQGGWTPQKRHAFGAAVIDQICNYSPNFRDLIAHMEIRTPVEIENEIGLTEGNIFQGELTIDQLLFNRPFPGYSQYRGSVKGMYLHGALHTVQLHHDHSPLELGLGWWRQNTPTQLSGRQSTSSRYCAGRAEWPDVPRSKNRSGHRRVPRRHHHLIARGVQNHLVEPAMRLPLIQHTLGLSQPAHLIMKFRYRFSTCCQHLRHTPRFIIDRSADSWRGRQSVQPHGENYRLEGHLVRSAAIGRHLRLYIFSCIYSALAVSMRHHLFA